MKKKKALAVLLIIAVLAVIAVPVMTHVKPSSQPSAEPTPTAGQTTVMTAGRYTGSSTGMKGPITVEVEVSESEILSVTIVDSMDTEPLFEAASVLASQIVEKQSIALDAVSGATISSYGILYAVKDALAQAGAEKLFTEKSEPVAKVTAAQEHFDVIVVGAGIAGLTTARDIAANSDMSVLLLDKLAYAGGSALLSGGALWSGGDGTDPELTRQKYVDTIVGAATTTEDLNIPLLERIYDVSYNALQELVADGLALDESATFTMPTAGIIEWSGKGTGSNSVNGVASDYSPGLGLTTSVIRMIEKYDQIDLRLNSKVTELIVENGAVKGVHVEDLEKSYDVEAEHIILATGGTGYNKELLEQYNLAFKDVTPYLSPGSTGDGFALVKDLNTEVVGRGMGAFIALNNISGYYYATGTAVQNAPVYVNKEGNAYMDASLFLMDRALPTIEQEGHRGYALFDANDPNAVALEDAVDNRYVFKADTIQELADAMGVNGDNLAKTAQEYGIQTAPYYGTTVVSVCVMTVPGVRVTENMEVLNADGNTIPNLYAVGEFTFGNIMYDNDPIPGNCIAPSLYMAKIVSEHIIGK